MTVVIVDKEQRTSEPDMVRVFYLRLLEETTPEDAAKRMDSMFTPEWKTICNAVR